MIRTLVYLALIVKLEPIKEEPKPDRKEVIRMHVRANYQPRQGTPRVISTGIKVADPTNDELRELGMMK